jgi:hypothetical protein
MHAIEMFKKAARDFAVSSVTTSTLFMFSMRSLSHAETASVTKRKMGSEKFTFSFYSFILIIWIADESIQRFLIPFLPSALPFIQGAFERVNAI